MANPYSGPCVDCVTPDQCNAQTGGCARLPRVSGTITLSGRLSTFQVWAPTLEFRVLRKESASGWEESLQQRWMEQRGGGIEWRDVPVVVVKV